MKVLIITRHFPPVVSGGARRALAMARGLASVNAEVKVMAPTLPDDVSGWIVAHSNVEPSRTSAGSPGLRDIAREWLLWPDPDIRWSRRAAETFLQNAGGFSPDWVVTTAPPESIHAAGAILKRRLGCRWAAEFRDHWLHSPLRTSRSSKLRRRLEAVWGRYVLRNADLLVSVDDSIQNEMRTFTGLQTRLSVLPQSADPPRNAYAFGPGRHVVYTGSFSLSDPRRDPKTLLSVFEDARQLNPMLRLHLAGRLTLEEEALFHGAQVRDAIEFHGVCDVDRVRALQAGADLGVVLAGEDSPSVPGKLYEYAAADLPALVLGGMRWVDEAGLRSGDPVAVMAGHEPGVILPKPMTSVEFGQRFRDLLGRWD